MSSFSFKMEKKESLFLLPLAMFNDELLILFYLSFNPPSGAELSALREKGGDNSSARPLVWLVELFLD